MLTLEPRPEVITFDCYGTLVQWHRAVREAVRTVIASHGRDDPEKQVTWLADRFRATAVAHQQRPPYRCYSTILRESLGELLVGIGLSANEEDHATLWKVLSRIAPHPDAQPALTRLRSRYRLAIISNTDDKLIAGTVAMIGAPIDFVITAQQARAYKPDHRLFAHAYEIMGVSRAETVHVGMGQVTDLKICHELGIRSVWIDREGEPLNPDWPPNATLPNLSALPGILAV